MKNQNRGGRYNPPILKKNKTNNMYTKNKIIPTSININESYEAESLEKKIQRIVNNKEPITDGAPIIYTERKDGIQAAYNIRTDRWDIACDAMDKVTKTNLAKRKAKSEIGEQAKANMEIEKKSETNQQESKA